MDAQELRNLQEAYMEVVMNELDEGMNIKQFEKKRRLQKQKENKALEKLSPTRRAGIHNPEKAAERAERRWIRSDKMGPGGELRTNKVRKAKALGELGEQIDIYDIILSHLLDEGYAETPEAAEAIMVNMSEEWRESIIG